MCRLFCFVFLVIFFHAPSVYATCFKVTGYNSNPGDTTISNDQGYASNWNGACDTCSGSLNLPNVMNLYFSPFQPYGTVLASTVVPFTTYGTNGGGYNPEQVFFKCALADDVYEMYSTNGDSEFGGWCNAQGTAAGNSLGLPYAYQTAWKNVIIRVTNLETNEYFKCEWQQRLLTGLDVDSTNTWKFVKAKNLASIKVDLYTASDLANGWTAEIYSWSQPNAYIAIKGPGLTGPTVGNTHASDYHGWHYNWPGAIGIYRSAVVRRYATCAVTANTPVVVFPGISVQRLNSLEYVEMPISVNFQCSSGFVSGVALNNTAIGVMVSPASLSYSSSLGLVNASGGVYYLLDSNYGNPGVANGVGVSVYRNNSAINLLASEDSALGSANANAIGWYPVLGSATNSLGTSGGVLNYSEIFKARFQKLSIGTQPPVTAGSYNATAQIIIRVQ